ncbi:hypothetical protein K504DRAFT_448562 [Pleomassaria siparia CBS 279.74]|uniref:Uncharacterized protein n=1 Tax=Pleomassaria siparia CBS 279.74 TaxID=1314801 RepID=A0A6G1JZB1_9PLEO|nr:hypothetical protein K504DRAFT_448562 [Pleomassaria siparia CBS 279.74]
MSPAPITQDAATFATPPISTTMAPPVAPPKPTVSPVPQNFDDIFHHKFMHIINQFRDDPNTGPLTQKDRKAFIQTAYERTDDVYYGGRALTDNDIKMRALTKVFYKVLAEEPWSDEWIRPHDVERKLSRFEMHKDSVELAARHGIFTPREAIVAARRVQTEMLTKPDARTPRGPWDDIEIIYIPGTVSSHATNAIDRQTTYPVSVSSVANILHTHICRDMIRPHAMAEKFVSCSDTEELTRLRKFACDICDFAPHLLDNDNISLLIVLLILTRSEICKRFSNNGIRIEGSTISHRRAECMKQKLGWKTQDDKKPFDNVALEFQTRVKNACFPAPRAHRSGPRKPAVRKSSTAPPTPDTSIPKARTPKDQPPISLYAPPQVRTPSSNPQMFVPRHHEVNTGINIPAPKVPMKMWQDPPTQIRDPDVPKTTVPAKRPGSPLGPPTLTRTNPAAQVEQASSKKRTSPGAQGKQTPEKAAEPKKQVRETRAKKARDSLAAATSS